MAVAKSFWKNTALSDCSSIFPPLEAGSGPQYLSFHSWATFKAGASISSLSGVCSCLIKPQPHLTCQIRRKKHKAMGFLPGFVLRPEGWQLPNGTGMSGAHCKTGSAHFPKSVLALALEAQPHAFLVCAFTQYGSRSQIPLCSRWVDRGSSRILGVRDKRNQR